MIQTKTYIIVLICFFVTMILSERYFKKHKPMGIRKLMLLSAVATVVLLTIVVIFPSLFSILIYGSVVLASFVSVCARHRNIARREVY